MKAALIARRELGDIVGDRSFVLGLIGLAAIPLLLVNFGGPRIPAQFLLIFGVQAALFPTFMTVSVASSTFIQDREGQTLLPLLAAPVSDSQIITGKLAAIFLPAAGASLVALTIFYTAASFRFGHELVGAVFTPEILYSLIVISALIVLTLASWSMVIASRVRTVRAAQQLSGILIAVLYAGIAFAAQYLFQAFDGLFLVALPLGILALDILALELARRLWGREEVIARI